MKGIKEILLVKKETIQIGRIFYFLSIIPSLITLFLFKDPGIAMITLVSAVHFYLKNSRHKNIKTMIIENFKVLIFSGLTIYLGRIFKAMNNSYTLIIFTFFITFILILNEKRKERIRYAYYALVLPIYFLSLGTNLSKSILDILLSIFIGSGFIFVYLVINKKARGPVTIYAPQKEITKEDLKFAFRKSLGVAIAYFIGFKFFPDTTNKEYIAYLFLLYHLEDTKLSIRKSLERLGGTILGFIIYFPLHAVIVKLGILGQTIVSLLLLYLIFTVIFEKYWLGVAFVSMIAISLTFGTRLYIVVALERIVQTFISVGILVILVYLLPIRNKEREYERG